MKVVIFGSRQFDNYRILNNFINYLRATNNAFSPMTEIISGGANGADKLGEHYAKIHGIPIKLFKPDWSLGKKAGPLRNIEMANYCDSGVCFDLGTKGTAHMIKYMHSIGKMLAVCPKSNFDMWENI